MRKPLLAIVVVALLASLSVQAQKSGSVRYKWQDANGLVHFSDSLTSDAMKYGYSLVNDRGLVVRQVPRQLTAAERAVANQLATEQAARDRAAKERADADARMLSAYPDEESYRISLQQVLEVSDQQIATTRSNLRTQEKALTDLLGRAADIENAKDPVPKALVDNITEQRNVVTGLRNTLHRQQNARTATVREQTGLLDHYRQLQAARAESDKISQP